jgi:O-antigen ligase
VQVSPLETHLATSGGSRLEFWATTLRAAGAFFPFGSGIGSFVQVYPLFDDPNRVDIAMRVPHAHNDYVELALETGLIGIALVLAFLAWWLARAVAIWRSAEPSPYARAATIASAAILLHSLVDYPLRTAGIAALFAMCLALMAHSPRSAARDERPLWKTRHLSLD